MKEFEPLVFFYVFQEMLGLMLPLLILLVVAGCAAFALLLWRERGFSSRRLVRAELFGILGAFLSLVLMAKVTVSGFTDAGGPVDWLLIGLVWGCGLAGTTILAYAILGWRERLSASA